MIHTPTYYRVRTVVRFTVGLGCTATICYLILWASAPI